MVAELEREMSIVICGLIIKLSFPVHKKRMCIGFSMDAFGSITIAILLSDKDAFNSSNGFSFLFFGFQLFLSVYVEIFNSFGRTELPSMK